jgi:hypothetical protein
MTGFERHSHRVEDRDDPENWRQRAKDARIRAAQMRNGGSRYLLMLTADSYDMMAELAERRTQPYMPMADTSG